MPKSKTISYVRQNLHKIVYFIFWPVVVIVERIIHSVLAKKYQKIIVWRTAEERLGHLAGNTELFLRRKTLSCKDESVLHIWVATRSRAANKRLFDMVSVHFTVIQNRLCKFFIKVMATRNPSYWDLYNTFAFNSNEYYEFNTISPQLAFSEREEAEGTKMIAQIGLSAHEYIGFHNRDSQYLIRTHPFLDYSYHNHRDSDVSEILPALRFLNNQNIWAVRIGQDFEKSVAMDSARIIESPIVIEDKEFLDLYVLKKCKFFIGNTSGPYVVALAFGTPSVLLNWIPLKYAPMLKNDIFIPKKLWSEVKERFLTFREIIYSNINEWNETDLYKEAGIKVVDNSADEILAVVQEMNSRIEDTWVETEEDKELQNCFRSLFQQGYHCYGFPSRIGANFLRENRQLLE